MNKRVFVKWKGKLPRHIGTHGRKEDKSLGKFQQSGGRVSNETCVCSFRRASANFCDGLLELRKAKKTARIGVSGFISNRLKL